MQVILLEKVANLGNLGDKVEVKSGFGRNFLIPYGKAVIANEANVAMFEVRRAELEKIAKEKMDAASVRAEKLNGLEVTITAKAADEGKLYGSITNRDVADAITAAGTEVETREVNLPTGPIRAIGEYDIVLNLHSDISATIKLTIDAEKTEA